MVRVYYDSPRVTEDDEVLLQIENGMLLRISRDSGNIFCMIDPFDGDADSGADIYTMDFDEFVRNIDEDEGEFTDDLTYIVGIAVDKPEIVRVR